MDGRFVARAVRSLAERQHGVVGRAQLFALGLTSAQIEGRCRSGTWTVLWRGVYALGHAPLTRRGWFMAAVLACGLDAVLSHHSAAELWQLASRANLGYHVSVPNSGGRRQPGITVHRRPGLDTATAVHGIPVTTPAQTILDTAALVRRRGTERMIDQADRLGLCTYAELGVVLEEQRGRRGAGMLRAVLAEHQAGSTVTRSHLEELFLALCRRAGLPQPAVNVELYGLTLDFYWPEHGVAVETDGWSSHRPKARFQHDIDRGNRLLLAGILPLRFSYDDVTRHAEATTRQLRNALRGRGPGL